MAWMVKHWLKSAAAQKNKVSLIHLMSVSSSTMRSQSALGTASLRKRFKMANVFPQCPSVRQKKGETKTLDVVQATTLSNTLLSVRKQLDHVRLLLEEKQISSWCKHTKTSSHGQKYLFVSVSPSWQTFVFNSSFNQREKWSKIYSKSRDGKFVM